jgi:hypothetical protein
MTVVGYLSSTFIFGEHLPYEQWWDIGIFGAVGGFVVGIIVSFFWIPHID